MKVYIVNGEEKTITVQTFDNVINEESLLRKLDEIYNDDYFFDIKSANKKLKEYLEQGELDG